MGSITIEFSQLTSTVKRMEGAEARLQEEILTATRQGGFLVMQGAVYEAPVDKGNLASKIGPPVTSKMGSGAQSIVVSHAAYSAPVHEGHRAFGPVNAKALRFEVGGSVVFARKVRATAPNRYMDRGAQRAEPQVRAAYEAMANRFAAWVTGA